MPWEPWLQAHEPSDPGERLDPNDLRLLVNIFHDTPDPEATYNLDWLEHLTAPREK